MTHARSILAAATLAALLSSPGFARPAGDSVLELRPQFGLSMVTAFIRVEGHPFGLTANNNAFIGGAILSRKRNRLQWLPVLGCSGP